MTTVPLPSQALFQHYTNNLASEGNADLAFEAFHSLEASPATPLTFPDQDYIALDNADTGVTSEFLNDACLPRFDDPPSGQWPEQPVLPPYISMSGYQGPVDQSPAFSTGTTVGAAYHTEPDIDAAGPSQWPSQRIDYTRSHQPYNLAFSSHVPHESSQPIGNLHTLPMLDPLVEAQDLFDSGNQFAIDTVGTSNLSMSTGPLAHHSQDLLPAAPWNNSSGLGQDTSNASTYTTSEVFQAVPNPGSKFSGRNQKFRTKFC